MLHWKLSKTLKTPKDPGWDLLVKSSLGVGVHSDRINGFLLSREALIEALGSAGISATPHELMLSNHSTIKAYPRFTISLSHTPDCGAALIAERKFFRSVGIDIEHVKRPVKESIIERISHEGDLKLRNIELWCLKEAVFKALMNTSLFPKPIEFSSIRIRKDDWDHSPTKLSGKWSLKELNSFVMAQAFLEN